VKRYLPFVIVAVVGLATVVTGTMLFRAKRPSVPISKNLTASEKPDADARHVRGEANAAVTLVEFGDFQCPPCGKLAAASDQIKEGYGSQLRVIFRHFPLHNHKHAQEAALASEAADLQGHFWEMHDLLYREQAAWNKADNPRALFATYAGTLGLDVDRFKSDMDGPEVKERVESDQKRGTALGITATPTIFINDVQIVPLPVDVAGVRAAIDSALKAKSPP